MFHFFHRRPHVIGWIGRGRLELWALWQTQIALQLPLVSTFIYLSLFITICFFLKQLLGLRPEGHAELFTVLDLVV